MCTCSISAQETIIGLGSRWSDSFKEWNIATTHDDEAGELRTTWAFRDDFSEWDFRLGDTTARIRQKWDHDPTFWEISSEGVTVSARTTWPRDVSSWRLSDGKHVITFKSKYNNQFDEWEVREETNGYFSVYTYYERDPRDWVVVDEMNEDISFALRLAMIFIAVYHGSPKV